LEEIARGGMGVVFRTRQVSLNRTVALKMILGEHFSSASLVQRFQTEAEAAARLEHPNIAPVYEIGIHESQHYFSMRFLEGGTLKQAMAKEKVLPRRAAELMATIARAVHHAHQRGVLHRDLKPGNILLDAQGEPHVTDFGLAKLLEADTDLTRTQALLGTVGYIAPEQASGGAKQLSTAADIFSLGAILYQLLTGRPPFAASNAVETIRQVVEKEPDRPRTLNAEVDSDLETVCLKCLEKEPGRRYDSALALAEDLDRWLQSELILARPRSTFERTIKWVKRKPATATLFAVIGLALVLGLVGLVVSNALITKEQEEIRKVNNRLNQEQVETRAALERETKALAELTKSNESLEEALRREEKIAYFRGIALAKQEWLADNLNRAAEILDDCKPKELRGWEWRYLRRPCQDPGFFTFEGHLGSGHLSTDAITYTPKGVPAAWVVREGKVKVLDALTGMEIFFYATTCEHQIEPLVLHPVRPHRVMNQQDVFSI
jgi:eukaryotic-like serine/threonine-protein kinase